MKKIYAIYKTPSYGFADFFRGYSFITENIKDVDIQWSINTPIRDFIEYPGKALNDITIDYTLRNDRTPLDKCIEDITELLKTKDTLYINSNRYSVLLDNKLKDLFILTPEANDKYLEFKHNLVKEPYSVIHTRLFDHTDLNIPCYEAALEQIENINTTSPTILLTNDVNFRSYVKAHSTKFITTNDSITHLGYLDSSTASTLNTLFEMKLMSEASEVAGITTFFHASSGFSTVPCYLFDVPYRWDRLNYTFKLNR